MTVLTKPNFVKMPDIFKYPLVGHNDEHNTYNEEKVEIDEGVTIEQAKRAQKCKVYVKWLKIFLLMVLTGFVGCGVALLENYMEGPRAPRYQGFCAVPVDNLSELRKLKFRAMSSLPDHYTDQVTERVINEVEDVDDDDDNDDDDDDVQVISTLDEQAKSDALVHYLSEELDIGDDIEKIYVTDALGKVINFIHDWPNNISGIVESERCLVMPIDPAVVLPPHTFVLAIEQGGKFQVSRAHSSLSVALPPLRDLSRLPPYLRQHCAARPTYHLREVDALTVRKRSVEEEKPHYMHFSGKHIHEIRVDNMEELLQHERGQPAQ